MLTCDSRCSLLYSVLAGQAESELPENFTIDKAAPGPWELRVLFWCQNVHVEMGNGIGAICNETHPTGLVFFCVIHMSFLSWNISGWFRILPSIFRSLSGFVDHRIVTRVMHPWCQDAKYTGTVSWFSVGRMGFCWSDMFDNILRSW